MNTIAKMTSIIYTDQEKLQIKERFYDYISYSSDNIPKKYKNINISDSIYKKYIDNCHINLCVDEIIIHQSEINKRMVQYSMNIMDKFPNINNSHILNKIYKYFSL